MSIGVFLISVIEVIMISMKLSVVFPSKNQSEKLLRNITEKGLPFFDGLGIVYEFIIVLDGSDEKNVEIMMSAKEKLPMQVKIAPYSPHLGKGHNVKVGIEMAEGDFVLFMDADFATDLKTLEPMLKDIDKYDGFIASRHLPESVIVAKQPPIRRFIGGMSRKMIRHRFHLPYRDTQCGFKMFRTDIAKEMTKKQIIDGFAFDVEYLYFMKLNGFVAKEYPCRWVDDSNSSISHPLKTSLRFMKDMRRIKKNRANYLLSEETLNDLRK